MAITEDKAKSYSMEFNKYMLKFLEDYDEPDSRQMAYLICSSKWNVSLESAKRYVRLGKSISIENRYTKMVDDSYDEDIKCHKEDKDIFPILCIPDLHIPFEHRRALQFCKDIYINKNIKTVVQLGDLVDSHALSFHTNELDAMTAEQEYIEANNTVKDWFAAFPTAYMCYGNHDKLPVRRAKEWGLPKSYMKSFHQLWGAPNTWNAEFQHEIEGVKFQHAGKAGYAGAINSAIGSRMSTVVGHQHSFGSIIYHNNGSDTIFGCNAGCLIDNNLYAFRYGRDFPNKPTLGCAVVYSSVHCEFIPMTGKYLK